MPESYISCEAIHEGRRSLIRRCKRMRDSLPVIIKQLKPEAVGEEGERRLRREYALLAGLDLPGVVKVLDLTDDEGGPALVLEDIGGEDLDRLLERERLPLSRFLDLAAGLAGTLAALHRQGIIHKDINPRHVIYNMETGCFRLIGFGLAEEAPRRVVALKPPAALEGTLAYISPEQTGRMNRSLDYRTDFYSLGVSFFQMLTGRLPFAAEDALGLLHCHIAQAPVAPHDLDPAIPLSLSRIVMKLLAKNAEDRYQSGLGLKADIERCRAGLAGGGGIPEFEPGSEDVPDRLRMPERLYGREEAMAEVLAAFDRAAGGGSELLVVAGYAGVGKTALIHESHKHILQRRGIVIEGKFDQLQRNVPYSAWLQALGWFVNQVLMESEAGLERWRHEILAALGSNGRVLTEVIPNLELIIGPQPAVAGLDGAEAQNRFAYLFSAFVMAIATEEHPLVVFLDDLQWIDPASLTLLHALLAAGRLPFLLIIGAYRDNEVDATHPLRQGIEALRAEQAAVATLAIGDLQAEPISRLLADTLGGGLERVLPLARLLQNKTGGNPFFMLQTLRSLAERGAIRFDAASRSWQWEMASLERLPMSDNVVGLMQGKIERLTPETRRILELAACLGFRFTLPHLAAIAGQSAAQCLARLRPALREGLLLPLEGDDEYQFAHDRIQQAAGMLTGETDTGRLHLEIGRLLLAGASPETLERRLFTVVDHLNQGAGLIEGEKERLHLARLNLQAGQKAKASAAFAAAAGYFEAGIALLSEHHWAIDYGLALKLHATAAEMASLTGDFRRVDELFAVVSREAKNAVDLTLVYESRMHSLISQNKLWEAIDIARGILALLDLPVPETPTDDEVKEALAAAKAAYAGRPIEALAELPAMTDPRILALMRVLARTLAVAYVSGRSNVFMILIFSQTALSVRHGNAAESAYAYAVYAQTLYRYERDIDACCRFGQVAVALLAKAPDLRYASKVLEVVNGHIRHFREHLRETLSPLEQAYQLGLQAGDFEYAGYCADLFASNAFFAGEELSGLERKMAQYHQGMTAIRAETGLRWQEPYWQAAHNLLGQSDEPAVVHGEAFDRKRMLPLLEATNSRGALSSYHVTTLVLGYLFGRYEEAHQSGAWVLENESVLMGAFAYAAAEFYDALALLQLYPGSPADVRETILATVAGHQRHLRQLAEGAPMNHGHKFHLVEAERLRVTGKGGEALEHYELAASLARDNGYIQEEALSLELAARFWLDRGQEDFARLLIRKACRSYGAWGAASKVRELEARHAPLFDSGAEEPSALSSEVLDLATVQKGAHAISREIEMDTLLEAVLRIVIENAGAQQGVLLLAKENGWRIAARGKTGMKEVAVSSPEMANGGNEVAWSVIRFVARTNEIVVLDDAANQGNFVKDAHIRREKTKSLICAPLVSRGKLSGILYLENNLAIGAFTPGRVRLLEMLLSQAAVSLENALVYEALRESEARFRRLAENAKDIIYRMSLPDGRYEYISPAVQELFGYEAEEFYAAPLLIREVIHPDSRSYFAEQWTRLLQGEMPPVYEYRIIHKSGEVRWMNQRNILIRNQESEVVAIEGIVTDVTERKKVEEELRQLNTGLDQRVRERTAELAAKNEELERMNQLFVGRELRMIELKKRISELEGSNGPNGTKDAAGGTGRQSPQGGGEAGRMRF